MLVWVWWLQGQQTCGGAYKRQGILFGDAKMRFWANLCWRGFCGTRASKPVMVHTNGKVSVFGRQNKMLLFACTTTSMVAPGPANLCWCIQTAMYFFCWKAKSDSVFCMHQHMYGGIRASKLVLVHTNGNVLVFWTAK